MPKPMTNREYVNTKGRKCPYCRSPLVEAEEVEIRAGMAYQSAHCRDCENEWVDLYQLAGWEPK